MTGPSTYVQRGIQWLRQLQPCQLLAIATRNGNIRSVKPVGNNYRGVAKRYNDKKYRVGNAPSDYHYPINRVIQQFKYEQQFTIPTALRPAR